MSKSRHITPVTDQEDVKIRRAAASDPEAPGMTDEDLARIRPASKMLPMIFGDENADGFKLTITAQDRWSAQKSRRIVMTLW